MDLALKTHDLLKAPSTNVKKEHKVSEADIYKLIYY